MPAPENPTSEEFEIHAKVEAWWRYQAHAMAVAQGSYVMEMTDDTITIKTGNYRETLSLEELVALPGFTGIYNYDGELVGWSRP